MTSPAGTAPAVNPPSTPTVTRSRVAIVVLVALAVIVGQNWYGDRHHDYDLRIYFEAMRWWAGGHPLYDFTHMDLTQGPLGFTYPPFAAVLMYPMAWLPLGVVEPLTLLANVAALGLTTVWLGFPVADRSGWPRWFVVALAVPLATTLEPIRETFTFGQINLLLAALVLADLLVAVPRKWRLAGVGIGLAAAIKLTPAIFIVYLLLARRWRTAATATATAAAATLLAAALAPAESWRYWTSIVWNANHVGHLDHIPNQAIWGTLLRLAAPHQPTRLLWLVLVLIVGGYGLWRASRAARAGDELAGLTLTGLVGLLISPVSWQHHLYWFVPAILVLVAAAAAAQGRSRWAYAGLAAFIWFTVTIGVIAFFDYGLSYRWLDTVPGFFISNWYLLLMLLLVVILPIRAIRGYSTSRTE
jgi:alpha-1,2-mannosyltransferase